MSQTTRQMQTVSGKGDRVAASFTRRAAGVGRYDVSHFAAENAVRVQVYTIGDLFRAEAVAREVEARHPGWTVLVAF